MWCCSAKLDMFIVLPKREVTVQLIEKLIVKNNQMCSWNGLTLLESLETSYEASLEVRNMTRTVSRGSESRFLQL